MMRVILQCEPFEQRVGNYLFRSNGFELRGGDVAHIYGLSDSGAEEFLYLIGGLQNLRGATKPAAEGRLTRREHTIPLEDLRFVKLLGQPLYELDPVERATSVGFIFENPDLFLVGSTTLEDFWYTFAAVRKAHPPAQVLERYGLYDKLDRSVEFLSGGERHRLNCASVLELSPRLLIADFSNSNLDKGFLADFVVWAEGLAKKGSAILMTGLRRNDLTHVAHRQFVLHEGQLLEGEPDPKLFPLLEEEREDLRSLQKSRAVSQRAILRVENVCRPKVTRPVSFELHEREILVIHGPNGCGKSTLGRILAGRVDRKRFSGDFRPSPVAKPKPVLSLQYPERSFVSRSVVAECPNKEVLEICGIPQSMRSVHPRSLPRAQQKLLSVGLTLMLSKGFAILDEPTSGMDLTSKRKFVSILNHFSDPAILIFTHDEAISGLGTTKAWRDISV